MKQLALFIPAAAFAIAALSIAFPTQVASRVPERSRGTTAAPGFYLQVERCHACSYKDWQKDTAIALEKSGVQSFVSDVITSHTSEQRYTTIRELPLRKVKSEGWPLPVYAGPFTSENQARDVISKLPSILKPALDKFLKLNAETEKSVASSPRLENCSGNHCSLAGYTINLIHVESTGKTGKQSGGQTETVKCHVYGDALINDRTGKVVTDAELDQYTRLGTRDGNDVGTCVVRVSKRGTHWEPCFIEGKTMYSNQDGKNIDQRRIIERRKSGAQHSKWNGDCLLKD